MKGSSSSGFGSALHLLVRFFGAIVPVGPRPAAEQWVRGRLSPAEQALFDAMSGPDRRHAIGVARRALRLAAADGRRTAEIPAGFVAAALLHDVGKNDAGLGTIGRVWATFAALAFGRARVVAWEGGGPPGALARFRDRSARYLQHDRIGAALLEGARSEPLTVSWAREHHLPPQRWSVEEWVGDYLKRADGD